MLHKSSSHCLYHTNCMLYVVEVHYIVLLTCQTASDSDPNVACITCYPSYQSFIHSSMTDFRSIASLAA